MIATVRQDIGGYVGTVFTVYTLILIVYLLSTMYFSFGGRMPYNRWSGAVIAFLRDVSEPYLRIFRRIIPPMGPLDLSPILGIIVLSLVGRLLSSLISG